YFAQNRLSIVSYLTNGKSSPCEFANYIMSISEETTGLMVLCDDRVAALARAFSVPIFTVVFDHKFEGMNLQNYFGTTISKVLRAFVVLSRRFDDEKNRKLLILPLRNFKANELSRLQSLFKEGARLGEISNSIDEILKQLRERQKPKKE